MATNQQVIDRALYKLGYLEYGAAADATDAGDALNVFNDMMHEWKQRSMDFNWFTQDTLGDTAPIPKWALNGVISNLAVRLGSEFNVAVTGELAQESVIGKRTIANTLINLGLETTDMSHLPQGSGVSSRYDINTDS